MNKYQKAFKSLKEKYERTLPYDDDEDLIKELVDRATPLKPLHKNVFKQFRVCSKCKTSISIRNHMKYCGKCGQAIDWSKDE